MAERKRSTVIFLTLLHAVILNLGHASPQSTSDTSSASSSPSNTNFIGISSRVSSPGGITRSQDGQTAYYSGASSSSYTATSVKPAPTTALGQSGAPLPPAPLANYQDTSCLGPQGCGNQQFVPEPQQQQFQAPPPPPVQFDSVLRPGEYVPNCGCVPRGSCLREIGEYTRLVGGYSDVVCGLNFERCCFDGPCPGVLDEFVRAAPCVPREQCLRPYGVLPTDVRDFGIIAPCPGHGAVRCITVNDAQLLQFQANVAAIEASQAAYEYVPPVQEENVVVPVPQPQPQPEQIIVPIVNRRPLPVPVEVPAAPAPAVPVTGQTTTVTTGSSSTNPELEDSIAQLLASVSKGEAGPITPSVVAPPTSGFVGSRVPTGGYRLDCRSSGCYTPFAYRAGFPGYYGYRGLPALPGVGAGLGFSKSFHFSKGFGLFG